MSVFIIKPGLDAGFREWGFVLNNFKRKPMKFLNFHQNPHDNEIILAKRAVGGGVGEWGRGSSNRTEPPLDPPLQALHFLFSIHYFSHLALTPRRPFSNPKVSTMYVFRLSLILLSAHSLHHLRFNLLISFDTWSCLALPRLPITRMRNRYQYRF